MLIHPWDEATKQEWETLLRAHDFGQLVTAGHVDGYPVVVPTHFVYDGESVLLHLARPNPVWAAIEADPHVVLSVIADYAYAEAAWAAEPGSDPDLGIPTSYYATVHLQCVASIVDDADQKAAILATQLRHFEPPTSTRVMPSTAVDSDRRAMPGIRGLLLTIETVRAKMKYAGNKEPDHRLLIAEQLARRDAPGDRAAREHMLRRMEDR